jgi:hypothetical protein
VVAGLLLLLVVVTLMVVPGHIVYARDPDQVLRFADLPWWVWTSLAAGMVMGVTATIGPLRTGVRALRAMEF